MMKKLSLVGGVAGLLLVLAGASSPRSALAQQPLMAALGDSITAAAFANVPKRGDPSLNPAQRFQEWLEESLRPEVIAENRRTFSWASGREVRSHFMNLRRYMAKTGDRRDLQMLNVADSGARADDMPRQAQEIANAMASGQFSELMYVTLFIGSNDACAGRPGGTPVESMRANLMQAFEILASIQQQPRIRILVPGIVRITDLGEAPNKFTQTVFGLPCTTVRDDLAAFCRPLTTWQNSAERARADAVVDEKNALLQQVVQEANARFPNLDVFFSPVLHSIEIRPSMLAVDCFHPGKAGHQILSDDLWKEQPWFMDDRRLGIE